jgi:hypothetical protein
MIAKGGPKSRKRSLLGGAVLGVALASCSLQLACPQARDPSSACDVTVRPLDLIPAGTVIGNEAPEGWTHLLLKSRPRAGAGDVGRLSADQVDLASFLITALVADVRRDGRRYRLSRVAVGMGTRVGDRDVIITPATQKGLGADLGFVARIVLSRAQEKLAGVVRVAGSPRMAVFDAPNLMLRGGGHRPVVLRYAVLVEEATGRLDTLVWLLDAEGSGPSLPAEWLAPSQVEDCVLHVDAREFTLGLPNEQSFALCRLPRGRRQLEFAPSLRTLAGRPRLSQAAAEELEVELRAALKGARR